jgi:hypothetical protein
MQSRPAAIAPLASPLGVSTPADADADNDMSVVTMTNVITSEQASPAAENSSFVVPASYPSPWALKFNDAQVSSFDGGLNWAYAFELPAGPGGVQPDLSLTYGSRRVDSLFDHPSPTFEGPTLPAPEIGYGWDLDVPEIAWSGVSGCNNNGNNDFNDICWYPFWMLRLGGQSIRLNPGNPAELYQ